jgi:hypothetical protein
MATRGEIITCDARLSSENLDIYISINIYIYICEKNHLYHKQITPTTPLPQDYVLIEKQVETRNLPMK